MAKVPYWHVRVEEVLGRCDSMTAEQFGCYMRLAMKAFMAGGRLPDNDDALAAMARVSKAKWRVMRPIMETLFKATDDGGLVDDDVMADRQRADDRITKSKQAGEASAEARALKTLDSPSTSVEPNKKNKENKKEREKEKLELEQTILEPTPSHKDLTTLSEEVYARARVGRHTDDRQPRSQNGLNEHMLAHLDKVKRIMAEPARKLEADPSPLDHGSHPSEEHEGASVQGRDQSMGGSNGKTRRHLSHDELESIPAASGYVMRPPDDWV